MFMPTVIETPEKRGFPQPFEPANEVKNEDSSDEEEEDDHNDVSAGQELTSLSLQDELGDFTETQ